MKSTAIKVTSAGRSGGGFAAIACSLLAFAGCTAKAGMPDLTLTQPHTIGDSTYNMPWATLSLPAGWGFNGGVIHANNCAVLGPSGLFTAESPDHRFGFVVLPSLKSSWTNDDGQKGRLQAAGCPLANSLNAEGFIRTVALPHVAPAGTHIDSVSPAPEAAELVQKLRAMNDQARRNAGPTPYLKTEYTVDAAKLRISFEKEGRHVAGQVLAVTTCSDQTMSFPGMKATRSYDCTAVALAASYAPAEELDAFAKASAFKLDISPAWTAHNDQVQRQNIANKQQQLMNAHNQNMANQQAQFAAIQRAHAAQQSGYDQYNRVQRDRSNAVHESNQAFAAHMGDYNDYTDPNTGQTVRASNQYDNNYMNSGGTAVLQTNQPGSPGVDWNLMVPRFK